MLFAGIGLLFPVCVTMLTFQANEQLGPDVAGALGNLAPLFAVLFAALLLGEVPSLAQSVGIVTIVAAAPILVLGSAPPVGRIARLALLPPGRPPRRDSLRHSVSLPALPLPPHTTHTPTPHLPTSPPPPPHT